MAHATSPRPASVGASLKRKEAAVAKLRELEYDKASGRVVDAVQAAKAVGHVLSIIRNRLTGLPSKVTPFLVLAQDAPTMRQILTEEIDLILTELTSESGPLTAASLRQNIK
jgi:hypothetical protein